MRNSKNKILFTLTLFGLSLFCTGLVAQDKDKEDKRSKWQRARFERPVPPVPPVPPIPPVQPVQPIQPIQPIASIEPIAPISPIAPIAPISPIEPIEPIAPIAPFTSILWDNGERVAVEYINDELGLNIKASGRIRLTADKKSIRSIRNDGFLQIKEQNKDSGREIYIETDRDGELVYDFYQKGKKLDFDKEGKAWLDTIWDDLVELLDK